MIKEQLKASELRIGNWISGPSDSYGKITAIDNIRRDEGILSVIKFDYGPYYHMEAINPIPITPEILEKAGYKYEKEGYNDFCISGSWTGDLLITQYDDGSFAVEFGDKILRCDFLHQLQNIVFYFTNQELNINL